MKNILIALSLIIIFSSYTNAQVSVSPWLGFNLVKINYKNVQNPNGNIFLPVKDYQYSFGANLNIPFLKKDKSYKIFTGIHYTKNSLKYALTPNIDGINSLESNIKWSNGFSQISIPISFYKSFYFNKTKTGSLSLFAGVSFGISYQDLSSYSISILPLRTDVVGVGTNPSELNEKIAFMPSFNGGFDIAPFQGLKNLKFGFLTIINLKESTSFQNEGGFVNITKQLEESGSVSGNPIFYNFVFNIKYDINFKRKNVSKIKKFDHDEVGY